MDTNNSPQSADTCPFCLANGIFDGEIVAESAAAYLTLAKSNSTNYLIIPKAHIERLTDLPASWWGDVAELLPQVPNLLSSYNMSVNIGKDAGQSVGHVHFWVIPREPGLPASGKGLARLVNEANQE